MMYWHVCDKISSKFCGIQHVFVNFAAPQPRKISKALYFDIGDRMKALQTLVTYVEAQKVVLEVKIVSIIMHCTICLLIG